MQNWTVIHILPSKAQISLILVSLFVYMRVNLIVNAKIFVSISGKGGRAGLSTFAY